MQEEQIIAYAPYIIIMIMFCANYKIFVTPGDLDKKLEKYVLKETNELAINQLKDDIADIKDKIDKIYDKVMNV